MLIEIRMEKLFAITNYFSKMLINKKREAEISCDKFS